jgi:hypothetical protein
MQSDNCEMRLKRVGDEWQNRSRCISEEEEAMKQARDCTGRIRRRKGRRD